MNILVAPDKFKGTLTAQQVCDAVQEGLLSQNQSWKITQTPLADGGEGTFEILTNTANCRIKKITVCDPLFRPIEASYGIAADGRTALIQMATASGLQLLQEGERNPLYTTTFGTGQLLVDALAEGVEKIVLGIGGSATNDAGIGMAAALGVRFLDENKNPLNPVGQSLHQISTMDEAQLDVRLKEVELVVLCDVANPLYGPNGAAYVYAPQKGANAETVEQLDLGLRHFASVAMRLKNTDLNFEGAGAAGGIGACAKLFCSVTFRKGIEFIAKQVGLEEKIRDADLIITGEGRVDEQTFSGKVVAHVIELAQQHRKKVVVVCGQSTLDAVALAEKGVYEIITLATSPADVPWAQKNAYRMIVEKTQQLKL